MSERVCRHLSNRSRLNSELVPDDSSYSVALCYVRVSRLQLTEVPGDLYANDVVIVANCRNM